VSVFEDMAPPDAPAPGLDVSVFGRLAVSLETLNDREAKRQAQRDQVPGDEQIGVGGTVPSSGPLVLDLGSVPQGRVWQVRRIVVGGPKATDTPTGHAFAYAQGAPPNDINTANVVDSWPSFTNGAEGSTYGTHQLWLPAGEHLWVVIANGTPAARWVASARIEDFVEAAFLATFYSE